MLRFRAAVARRSASNILRVAPAPPAAVSCRHRPGFIIGFALTLLLVIGPPPVAVASASRSASQFDLTLDHDRNGVEDFLDGWVGGTVSWQDLRLLAAGDQGLLPGQEKSLPQPPGLAPAGGIWQAGGLRVLHLGSGGKVARVLADKSAAGHVNLVHDLALGGGVQVLAVDQPGLALLLSRDLGGRLLLDRCGTPALDTSRGQVGVPVLEKSPWRLGRDWSATVAILDSGCDTAHGDLGDPVDDDIDGPPPAVGDAGDWSPADSGWPLDEGFKVVGWHDVTDDFPLAAGPWDYHYHGTALASVVGGSGHVQERYRGMAPAARLTIVKFYDFDGEWRTWAGDFLAACSWTLAHADVYRIRAVLCAVNWDQDAGISDAMSAFAAAGIVPVAAVGNQGSAPGGPGYPARLPEVLAVGAVDDQGAVSAYSGRGTSTLGKPDLVAPGGGLLIEAGRITAADNEPNDSYHGRVGTSLAAAHVAGAVYMVGDALRDAGLALPGNITSVRNIEAVLKSTCAPVTEAETGDGSGVFSLPPQAGPDSLQGWGLLRIDAAVRALRQPLGSGETAGDTLGAVAGVPVMARRLVTSPGVRYRVEAAPAPGLDVRLEVVDPRWLDDDPQGGSVLRADDQGPGGAESVFVTPEPGRWLLAVVKVKQGQGDVDLSLREDDTFAARGRYFSLPGPATGAPNLAHLDFGGKPQLVIPSRVTVDPVARALNVVDMQGVPRPGWPVFLFPSPSSQGGLNQPLAWDLDLVPGDEIVASANFGRVYFFAGDGTYQEVELNFNRPLTPPVGMVTGDGGRMVSVVDQIGVVRAWKAGPVLQGMRNLGHLNPLAPAAGRLVPDSGEALVVAFGDGFVTALDENLAALPGWPLDLGQTLALPPVLVDRDGDGLLEVVVPVWSGAGDDLTLRVLRGDGAAAPDDGALLTAPAGGRWRSLSSPVVGGGYRFGGLNVDLVGLMDNGLAGDGARWSLGCVRLGPSGPAADPPWPGFLVEATADQSTLVLDQVLMPPPLEYNGGGGANEPVALVHLQWQDLLYGLKTMPGAVTGLFRLGPDDDPLAQRDPLDVGGEDAPAVSFLGAMLVPAPGTLLRVLVQDARVGIQPLGNAFPGAPFWLAARGDGRNSGAAALQESFSPASLDQESPRALEAFPNPGSGRIYFRSKGVPAGGAAILEIYDLRGRRLFRQALSADPGSWFWDGDDARGRPLPAGVYLATVRQGARRVATRLTLTR